MEHSATLPSFFTYGVLPKGTSPTNRIEISIFPLRPDDLNVDGVGYMMQNSDSGLHSKTLMKLAKLQEDGGGNNLIFVDEQAQVEQIRSIMLNEPEVVPT